MTGEDVATRIERNEVLTIDHQIARRRVAGDRMQDVVLITALHPFSAVGIVGCSDYCPDCGTLELERT
jgi:hypothetical protein